MAKEAESQIQASRDICGSGFKGVLGLGGIRFATILPYNRSYFEGWHIILASSSLGHLWMSVISLEKDTVFPCIDGCGHSGTCCMAEKDVPYPPWSWPSSDTSTVLISPSEPTRGWQNIYTCKDRWKILSHKNPFFSRLFFIFFCL